jgi:hypothetical protein
MATSGDPAAADNALGMLQPYSFDRSRKAPSLGLEVLSMVFCVCPVFKDSFSHNTFGHSFIIFGREYGRRCSQRGRVTIIVISKKLAIVAKIQRPVQLGGQIERMSSMVSSRTVLIQTMVEWRDALLWHRVSSRN